MRVEQRSEEAEERLSTEELHALRARLFGETSSAPKTIATVADLAEALGRSPEEVWAQLDRLRAESAFSVPAPAKSSQWPLLGVAIVLLGAAFGIYKVTPRKLTEAEIDARLAQIQRERDARPKKIRYPIETKIPLETAPAPYFAAEFQGPLTKTAFEGRTAVLPREAAVTERDIRETLRKVYAEAVRREVEAPIPKEPIKRTQEASFRPVPTPEHLTLIVRAGGASHWLEVPYDAALAGPMLDGAARSVVATMQDQQQKSLDAPERSDFYTQSPPGFVVETKVDSAVNISGAPNLGLRPIDAGKVRHRLEIAIRDQIRRAVTPNADFGMVRRAVDSGAIVELKVTGPLRPIVTTLPLKPGGEYKTAADAKRAYEVRLREVLDEAERQIREINKGTP